MAPSAIQWPDALATRGAERGFETRPRVVWGQPHIDWAFEHLGWTEVIHCIDPANTASQALAIRLGATSSGPGRLPPPFARCRSAPRRPAIRGAAGETFR